MQKSLTATASVIPPGSHPVTRNNAELHKVSDTRYREFMLDFRTQKQTRLRRRPHLSLLSKEVSCPHRFRETNNPLINSPTHKTSTTTASLPTFLKQTGPSGNARAILLKLTSKPCARDGMTTTIH